MSVLDKPSIPEITPAMHVAASLKQSARATYQNMLNTFEQTTRLFWRNSRATPAEIASALGTDAAEVFALHAKLGGLLNDVKPGCLTEINKLVGTFTANADGTVTINSVPTPMPVVPPQPSV